MNSSFKDFIKTPKGKLICSLCVLGVTWSILLLNFAGGLKDIVPSADKLKNAARDLKRKEIAYEAAKKEKEQSDAVKASFNAIVRSSWIESKHGMVESTLRQMVSDTAQAHQLKLSNLGSVKTSRINNDFYFAEIDVSFQSSYPDALKFIAGLQNLEPHLAWKRFDIRPDFRSLHRINANASSIAGMVAKNSGENIGTLVHP